MGALVDESCLADRPRRRATSQAVQLADGGSKPHSRGLQSWLAVRGQAPPADRLVMYVFSDSDPEYLRNLEFFVAYGMAADDGSDYVVVVQEVLCGSLPLVA